MIVGTDGGEGSSVGAWREFTSWIQVQVLCEIISWWWSYKVELCTMYDSHGVYLRVLWTIYMYKFRCRVGFHDFFIPFTDFRQKSPDF
jgi:hypothetical protein